MAGAVASPTSSAESAMRRGRVCSMSSAAHKDKQFQQSAMPAKNKRPGSNKITGDLEEKSTDGSLKSKFFL